VPFVTLAGSPLVPGVSPVRIHYRVGRSPEGSPSMECDAVAEHPPIVFLHSGWGYEIYPFDRQMAVFAPRHRVVIPDRSGYGQSTPIETLPADFHHRAAEETRAVVEALGLDRPVLWGHSDGAIIALLLALATPERVRGVIAEATHFYRRKPRSQAFFESMIGNRPALGDSMTAALARDHGPGWPQVLERHSRAWQSIAGDAASDEDDFYGGRLSEIGVPVLVIHGARDPRTEPGEIEAVARALRAARGVRLQAGHAEGPAKAGRHVRKMQCEVVVLPAGGHSPHSEPATAADVSRIARPFLDLRDPPALDPPDLLDPVGL
jgi:pimeloyl-ACP methyl ester carboxylesterase